MTCLKTTFVFETNVLVIFINNNVSEQNMNSVVIITGIKIIKEEIFFLLVVDFTVLRALSLWLVIIS